MSKLTCEEVNEAINRLRSSCDLDGNLKLLRFDYCHDWTAAGLCLEEMNEAVAITRGDVLFRTGLTLAEPVVRECHMRMFDRPNLSTHHYVGFAQTWAEAVARAWLTWKQGATS